MIESPRRGWELPGGQVEEGDDLMRALAREVLDETWVPAVVDRLVAVYSRLAPPFMDLFGFLGQYQSGDLATSEESLWNAWAGFAMTKVIRDSSRVVRYLVRYAVKNDNLIIFKSGMGR